MTSPRWPDFLELRTAISSGVTRGCVNIGTALRFSKSRTANVFSSKDATARCSPQNRSSAPDSQTPGIFQAGKTSAGQFLSERLLFQPEFLQFRRNDDMAVRVAVFVQTIIVLMVIFSRPEFTGLCDLSHDRIRQFFPKFGL